jgi:hypothetical protein
MRNPFDDGLAIAVGIDGRAEDFRGVERRGGGKADLHGVEVVEHAAILGDVIVETAKGQLRLGQLAVEQITAMTFIDDDAVVLIDGGRWRVLRRIKHAGHHALDGGDVNGGVGIGFLLVDFLDAENVRKGLQTLHAGVLERISRLLAERGAIREEENAAKALRFQQPVDERDAGLRLAGAGGHGEEHGAQPGSYALLRLQNGQPLIIADDESIIESLRGELLLRGYGILFEKREEALG